MKKLTLLFFIFLLVVGYVDESKENVIVNDPLDPVLYKIIKCESQFKHEGVWGTAREYGWCQFKKKTFNWMKELAGRPELKWKNKQDQLWLLKWALENGYGSHWTCWRKMKIEEGGFV